MQKTETLNTFMSGNKVLKSGEARQGTLLQTTLLMAIGQHVRKTKQKFCI